MDSRFKFPRRVRIHGGECGAVARALHHKAQKDALIQNELQLISDEYAFSAQAELEKASRSTHERKKMSTKTSIKRIALVAIASLGFGVLSAGVSSAAVATVVGGNVTTNILASTTPQTLATYDFTNPGTTQDTVDIQIVPGTGQVVVITAVTGDITAGSATALVGTYSSASGLITLTESGSGPTYNDWNTGASDVTITGYITGNTGSTNFLIGAHQTTLVVSEASPFRASFSVPTAYDVLTQGTYGTARNVGSIQIDLASISSSLTGALESATVTMAAGTTTGSSDFLNALSFADATATGTGNVTTAGTGYNVLNNATATRTSTTVTVKPTASNFSSASGRQYILFTPTSPTNYVSGAKVTFTMTAVSSGGIINTFTQTLTLTIGTKAGTGSTPVTTGVVSAGGTVSATYTQPYTNVPALSTLSAVDAPAFALTETIANGDATFNVTGVATGGSVFLTRTNATTITPTVVKNELDGSLSVTYTISVTVPLTAQAGETVSVYGYTWTVQPYVPTYSYSTADLTATGTGYYQATGDNILWAPASLGAAVATVPVVQKDQFNVTIGTTKAVYLKTVVATITGKGSLAAITGPNGVTKTQTYTLANGGLTAGSPTLSVFAEGVSGEGTLTITVDGLAVKTYTMRFFGDIATIDAVVLRPVGSSLGGENGREGATSSAPVPNVYSAKTVGDPLVQSTRTAVAALVKDSNGWVIPTGSLTTSISDPTTLGAVTFKFLDSGISDVPAGRISAGTFARHYTYTTVAGASGKTSTITFSIVNAAGTTISSTPVTVSTGGPAVKTTLSLDKSSYTPGEAATLTATAVDAAGNKAADGDDLMAGGIESSLDFSGVPGSLLIVNGKKVVDMYAPLASGTWTITASDAFGNASSVTATVVNQGVQAANQAANQAAQALSAAEAAADAAAEAIDAANAATDAANLAAEAADAATVAAEEARDAADAATAAVEELAQQVATLMAALKAQITTLANTVAKIAKKVKA